MVARNRPVSPPIVKSPIKPNAYSIGVSKEIEPLYSVAVQLKTFTADGTATRKLSNEKTVPAYRLWPETKRWCPQTRNPTIAIARLETATNPYPKIGFRAKHGTISLITP